MNAHTIVNRLLESGRNVLRTPVKNKDVFLSEAALPTKRLRKVYHIGTFNPEDRGAFSFEGNSLSVSLHPEEWSRIARLGGFPWWSLSKSGGKFIDAHKLSDAQWESITAWGIRNGYVQQTKAWKAFGWDEYGEKYYSLHDTKEEAAKESDEVEETNHIKPTSKLSTGRETSLVEVKDHLLVAYAEQAGFDGVWWDDEFGEYSAPRGAIVPSKISSWEKTLITEGVD